MSTVIVFKILTISKSASFIVFSLLVEKRFCTMRHYLDNFLYIKNAKTNKPNRNTSPAVIKEFKNELP